MEETVPNQLKQEVLLGEVIWVETSDSSWWPAQVADEKTVCGSTKPVKRLTEEVLIRLYGSYKYLYVDPIKSRSDFEIILEKNDGSYRNIFKKALEQDINNSRSGRSKKRRPTENDGKKKNGAKKIKTIDDSLSVRVSQREKSVTPRSAKKEPNSGIPKKEKLRKKGKEDSPRAESGGKGKSSKKDEQKEPVAGNPSSENRKKKIPTKTKSSVANSSGKYQELSERQMRVRRSLGLLAPSGSPFQKNGHL